MKFGDNAIEILSATEDGDKLKPEHLKLVEMAVNGHLDAAGDTAFLQLYQDVTSGEYLKAHRWFYGIEHLTKDHEGYVYWKDKSVEHFSFRDADCEAQAARKLADRCIKLEANGFPINVRTATSATCYDAPAGTPWMDALCRYYSFFQDEQKTVGIFYRRNPQPGESLVFAAYKLLDKDGTHVTLYDDAYIAFHALHDQGMKSAGCQDSYDEIVALLEATGLSSVEVEKLINATT